MFFRVRANLPFTNEDEANDFYHDCQVAFPKASIINPGLPNQETRSISLGKCYHDQDPTIPCEVINELSG